jgi:hypothetical protein
MLVAALLLPLCGCTSDGKVVLVNRSDAVLTVGPGVVVPACDSLTLTRAEYLDALELGTELFDAGQSWDAPPGALAWNSISMSREEVSFDTTMVVSSVADVNIAYGEVADASLPSCGGPPRGILPGVPLPS